MNSVNFDLPDLVKYQLVVIFKFELPFDTGNLRHNAARLILMKPGARYRIDEAEADYTRDVFEYYLFLRGENFMYNAAKKMHAFLSWYFEGYNFTNTPYYKQARKSIGITSKGSEERDVRNILHGTGMFAQDSMKEKVLGTFNEFSFTKQVLN